MAPEPFYNEDAWDTIKTGKEFEELGMARLLGQVPESLDLMRHKEFAVQPSPHEEMLRQEFIAYGWTIVSAPSATIANACQQDQVRGHSCSNCYPATH
ncbi:hypothetical protein NW767_013297 [Fusarium falciforme]|nr:hypothetical protein NW767_013297 [Fusarium falciforme]